jgi:hypothetical protein
MGSISYSRCDTTNFVRFRSLKSIESQLQLFFSFFIWMGFHRVFIKEADCYTTIEWIPEKWNFLVERNNNSSLSCPIHLMWQMTSIIHHFSSLFLSFFLYIFLILTLSFHIIKYCECCEYSTVQTTHILVMRKVPIHFPKSKKLPYVPCVLLLLWEEKSVRDEKVKRKNIFRFVVWRFKLILMWR